MLYRTHIAAILLLASILPAISHAEEATDPQVLFEEAMALRDAINRARRSAQHTRRVHFQGV